MKYLTKETMCDEWDLLNGIRILCERYLDQDSSIEGWKGSYNPALIGSLQLHMAFIYRVTIDATMCQILKITPKTSDPDELEYAMYLWLGGSNHSALETTIDGRHLYFSDISGCGPKWYPLPVMFREKWLDAFEKYKENTENYILDFLYNHNVKSTR